MPKTIQQTVTLPAPAEKLYDMYLDAKTHGEITGATVVIDSAPGSEFQAFDGMLSGTMLQTVPKRLIVQAWRAKSWAPDDVDSTLVLRFHSDGDSGCIELVHVNVADHDADDVNAGWEKYYWRPWREYLSKH